MEPQRCLTLPYGRAQLGCGGEHTIALDVYGDGFSWGCARHGQLGVLTTCNFDGKRSDIQLLPRPIQLLGRALAHEASMPFEADCEPRHSGFGAANAHEKSFGSSIYRSSLNGHGEMAAMVRERAQELDLSAEAGRLVSVACGESHTLLLTQSGVVLACGQVTRPHTPRTRRLSQLTTHHERITRGKLCH